MSKNESKKFSPFARQCFVTCAVCSNATALGCSMGFPGVLLPQLRAQGQLSDEVQSWIASVMALSIFMGLAMASPLMGRLGRKAAAYASVCTSMLGWSVLALSPNIATLIIGRICQGISFGVMMPLRALMIGEYTSPRYRGSFLTTISLSQSIGIIFVHTIGTQLHWQYTAIICSCFPLTSFIMLMYSPESPSWLAVRGRYEDCRNAFRWLRGDTEEEEMEKMIKQRIVVQHEHEIAEKISKFKELKQIARKKEVFKPVLIAIHVFFLTQFSGALTLANYSSTIIQSLMGSDANTSLWMIEIDVFRLITNALAVFVIAKFRRRTILFAAGTLSVASHVAIAGYIYGKHQGTLPYDALWIPVLLLNMQVAAMGFGMVPMATILTGEIFPLEYRSALGTISSVAVTGTMFITLKTFPGLFASAGLHGTYGLYGAIIMYSLTFLWFMLPETKGSTLQQIEEHFRGKPLVPKDKLADCEMKLLKSDAKANGKV